MQYPSGSGYLPDFFIIGSYFVLTFTCSITFFQESIPQVPFAFTPVFFWKTFRDVSVSSPKRPSTVPPSTDCSTETATPEFPFRMIGSWVSNFPVRTTAFLNVPDTLLFRSSHRWCIPVSTLSSHSQGSCMLRSGSCYQPRTFLCDSTYLPSVWRS